MAALAKIDPINRESSSVMSMIERVAGMPDIPVERLEQLFSLHQRVEADKARTAFFAALSEMQPELPIIERTAKAHANKYARWEDIVEKIMPVLQKHGFAISFRVGETQANKVDVTCILSHRAGHSEQTMQPYPYDTSGNKPTIHAIASATSYGKRYTASALLNIVTKDEDDDAKAAAGSAFITDAQVDELTKLIQETGIDYNTFLKIGKVESLSDVLASEFDAAKKLLLSKKQKGASK
jgi:hypothetical protein